MDVVSCRPTKHEISYGETDNTEECGYKSVFGGAKPIFLDVGDEVLELVGKENRGPDNAGYSDDDEAEAGFTEIESVDWAVN